MERNVCGTDRLGRLVLGPALVVAAVVLHRRRSTTAPVRHIAHGLLGLWGLEILTTGLVRWCPLNYALGIDTCERDWPAIVRDLRSLPSEQKRTDRRAVLRGE